MAENLLGGLVFDLSCLRLRSFRGHRTLDRYSEFFGLVEALCRGPCGVHWTSGWNLATPPRIIGILNSELQSSKPNKPKHPVAILQPSIGELRRYADLMLDAMIAVLIFFFPGGFNIQTLGCLGVITLIHGSLGAVIEADLSL